MATLKDHQQAMVDLLASGSGIPASASRLAHAMHDVLSVVMGRAVEDAMQQSRDFAERLANDATTPGLNDKALSKPVAPTKTDSPAKWPLKAEQRIKQLNNTIQQLRDSNAKLREDYKEIQVQRDQLQTQVFNALKRGVMPKQAGCRKDDTQVCEHEHTLWHHNLGDSVEVEYCSVCQRVLSERPV